MMSWIFYFISQNFNTSLSNIYLFQKIRFGIFIFYFSEFQHFFVQYLFSLENEVWHFIFIFFSQFQHFFFQYLFTLENEVQHFYFLFFRIPTLFCPIFIYFRKWGLAFLNLISQNFNSSLLNIYLFQKMRFAIFNFNFSEFQYIWTINRYEKYILCCCACVIVTQSFSNFNNLDKYWNFWRFLACFWDFGRVVARLPALDLIPFKWMIINTSSLNIYLF